MRIYLTGATGYLGGQLAARLAREGHEVRALVRPASETRRLADLGVTLCPGDLTDRYSLREGMSGADWVVHAAAHVRLDAPLEELEKVNVQGTENVVSLASKLGVGRVLVFSSVAAFGGSPEDGSPATEESPVIEPFPNAYGATKARADLVARRWAEQGLRLNTVYPSLVFGPPGKRSGSNGLLRTIARGSVPLIVGGDRKTSWIYIDDLTDALTKIVTGDVPPGRDYILAGDVVTVEELMRKVCRVTGAAMPRWRLSASTAHQLLRIARPLARLVGRRLPILPEQSATLRRHWAFDDSRARQELDWHPRPLEDGLRTTFAFFSQTPESAESA